MTTTVAALVRGSDGGTFTYGELVLHQSEVGRRTASRHQGTHTNMLMAAALRHGLYQAVSVEEAAAELVRLARGDTMLIERALARVGWAQAGRRSDIGHFAHDALARAQALAEHSTSGTEEDVLGRLVDAVPAMLSYWDADQRNVTANAAFEPWFGISPCDLRGAHLRELLGDDLHQANGPYIRSVLAGAPQQFQRSLVDVSGAGRLVQASYTPDIVGGRVAGFSVLITDLTPLLDFQDLRTAPMPGVPGAERAGLRVLVVDADHVARAGLRSFLASAPDMEVVAEAADAEGALAAVAGVHPDVVVIDARLRGVERVVAAGRVPSPGGPTFKIVVLATTILDEYGLDPRVAEASCVLPKQSRREELIDGIRGVARGQGQRRAPAPRPRPTPREREVLDLVARGLSNKEIASRLYLSVDTVKTHLRHLYEKLGVTGRQELIVAGYDTEGAVEGRIGDRSRRRSAPLEL